MREEQKLNKAIKQDGIDTQSEILEELKRRYPQYVKQKDKARTFGGKRRFAFISAIAAVAVCAAIVVPCAVLLPNRKTDNGNGGEDNFRYCTYDEYEKSYVEYTILEYRKTNNLNFLYFDWYEIGEDCDTSCYTSILNNEILCLEEKAYLPQSDDCIQLSITKANVYLSEFDLIIASCTSEQTIENRVVKWGIKGENVTCIFEDNGYRYFIQIEYGQDENRLFELVAELLETK